MKAAMKASLEEAIEGWVNNDAVERPESGYVHDELAEQMAAAAAAVYDGCMSAQAFAANEEATPSK